MRDVFEQTIPKPVSRVVKSKNWYSVRTDVEILLSKTRCKYAMCVRYMNLVSNLEDNRTRIQ